MSADGSFSSVCLHVGADWRTYCHTYDDRTPILALNAGASVSVSIKGRNADQAAVEFARALVRDAQVLAAEVERLHAAQLEDGDGDAKAAGSDAA